MAGDYFDQLAGEGFHSKGETSLNTPGYVNMTFKQPIGPVAAIIPVGSAIQVFVTSLCLHPILSGTSPPSPSQ